MSFSNWLSLTWRTVCGIFTFEQHQDVIGQYPLTCEQRDTNRQVFIDSINQDAVCALASRHNDQQPCRILYSDSGSFNVCFFVEFLTSRTKWVVRIPIEPVTHDAWTKVRSEVMTMRHIESQTAIPLPRIRAYGRGERLVRDSPATQAYIILDFVPGRSLDLQALAKDTVPRRKYFYSQLIDVMAQLRQLEFTAAGSLMPADDGGPDPAIGNLLSIPSNELRIDCKEATPISTSTSAISFALHQHRLMSESYRLPRSELSPQTAELELFALDHLQQLIPELISSERVSGPFVLFHSDLRPTNIIVDDDLNIRSIIDWEWAYTVPQQLFMPPSWVTGQDLDYPTATDCHGAFPEFHEVLEEKAASSESYRQLADSWGPDLPNTLILPLAQILQHHSNLIRVYYKFIFPRFFQEPRDKVLAQFFRGSSSESKNRGFEVQQRIANSERYTQYLKDNGLFIPDEEAQMDREWLEKAKELQERFGIDSLK
ncbi:hypothetical protein CEP51_005221 [Fusarium floridanum]|uniref:Aminoglycoside phosphotransferase domain-containing protein n=1 Tax=Fusarium floridanum TaxID=1325733 RepID=A0A428RY00_9HYPO|nr:hypothetical protein CEP51_005221 [Fusarium floridanum]